MSSIFIRPLLPPVLLLLSLSSVSALRGSSNDEADVNGDMELGTRRKCELITVPLCMNVGYNYTSMPNRFGQLKQEEAGLEVHQYYPLVEVTS